MKWFKKDPQKTVKGMPSAVLLSILIHAALFLLAGLLVVFTVVKVKEPEFEAPKAVERPKMKLKKPKVKMKKTSRPRSTTRIVTQKNRASMPDIQLPEMSGLGEGLGGGLGDGFSMLPELSETTLFGAGLTTGNDFIGTFYDLKRRRDGSPGIMDVGTFRDVVARFVRGGWNKSELARYYRSPKKLFATTFMVPTMHSSAAPAAFGEDTGGWCWLMHYEGKLVHKDGITFRFWGQGDDILVVRVDNEVVLNGSYFDTAPLLSNWQSSSPENRIYQMGNATAVVGDWITLEPGVPLDMEVICGEVPGGEFDMMLVVEEKGVEYEVNSMSGPILPIFKTVESSHDLQDIILEWLVPGEASVMDGPVFSDFSSESGDESTNENSIVESEPDPDVLDENALRIWTTVSGKTAEAEYVATIGGKVTLKTAKGKQLKIPMNELSDADREFIELSNPPTFKIDFTKKSSQRYLENSPFMIWDNPPPPPRVFDWTFGVKLKQMGTGVYNHELNVEMFAIGQQYLDNEKFVLLDRQTTSFTPTRENKMSHQFRSENSVELKNYELKEMTRGYKIKGHLILVTDSLGKIIQHDASNEWFYEKREKLQKLQAGSFFDNTGNRVYPTGPKRYY